MSDGRWFRLLALLIILCVSAPACGATARPTSTAVTVAPTPLPVTFTPAAPRSFTTPHPLLGDVRIRQGIAYCINRTELIKSVYPWLEDAALLEMDSFLPRTHWAYPMDDPAFVRYPFDPQKGQALFEAAGWHLAPEAVYRTNAAGEEMSLKLTTTEAQFRQAWAFAFEQQMKNCGLRIVRFHTPAEWFFGETTGLARRDFELAAYAWVSSFDPDGRALYQCDQIPSPENNWQGQNYAGWCNPRADDAIRAAGSTILRDRRAQAYRSAQQEFAQDVPGLPLFHRLEMHATHPALENFAPDASQVYTWNAAQWKLPGKDTIVLAESSEPALLFDDAYVSQVIRALVFGLDYTSLNYDFQPVTLRQLPTIENGGAAQTPQLVVRYEFVNGLTWSDGTPVSKADYELAYRILCDPETWKSEYGSPPPACDKIAQVEFVNDTTYIVTWEPGYQDPQYFLPPLGRLPAHQVIGDGRKLAEVPAREWFSLTEVGQTPLGVGPYVIKEWVYGEKMLLTANPYYHGGPPSTPNIVIRFLPADQIVGALVRGEVDIVGWDSLYQDAKAMGVLIDAQAKGKIRLHLVPSAMWERIDFALFVQ